MKLTHDAIVGYTIALILATLITWFFIPWRFGGMYMIGEYLGYL